MSILGRVVADLSAPDDQGRDWYGWCTNQMSHAFLGVVTALFFQSAPIVMAAVFALLKESIDFLRVLKWRALKDSVADIAFWLFGAWIASAGDHLNVAVIVTCFALVCGIIPRIRR